ncbi:Protein Skeletor:-like isoforms D/E, partial [Leptotrombidium deliense]
VEIGAKGIYKGKFLGSFPSTSAHSVAGKIYAVNDDTLYVEKFSYDGAAPAAFFWAGTTEKPSVDGFVIPVSLGSQSRLQAYKNQNLLLKMPDGRKISDVKWISIWCKKFTANFGHINIPQNFDAPKEVNLGRLPSFAHGVSADAVIIKDSKTIFIKGLRYDGAGPDAFFLVGKGKRPHGSGIKVPDENGRFCLHQNQSKIKHNFFIEFSLEKLHGYKGEDITLHLPGDLTIKDIDWFSLYCIRFSENFGHIKIRRSIKNKMPPNLEALAATTTGFPNCETIFKDILQVSWDVKGNEIYIQLEGKIDDGQYMSFGLSGAYEKAQMVGADVAVAYFDSKLNRAIVQDYILTAKSQCNAQTGSGACPDSKYNDGKESLELVSWSHSNGFLNVVYKRKLDTGDEVSDHLIEPDRMATVIAAIGPLNSQKETAFHFVQYTKSSDEPIRIAFSRPKTTNNCKSMTTTSSPVETRNPEPSGVSKTWKQHVIQNVTTLKAQIGPAGGSRGYTALTGIQSWGISWWINGFLIPEIHVERGKDYTFIVEGGDDPSKQATYHPLYITNSEEGGGAQYPDSLNTEKHKIYAGVILRNGTFDPSPGSGRYCEWTPKSGIDKAEEVSSFEEYKNTLKLECRKGNPAIFVWRPNKETPNIVYYQVKIAIKVSLKTLYNLLCSVLLIET